MSRKCVNFSRSAGGGWWLPSQTPAHFKDSSRFQVLARQKKSFFKIHKSKMNTIVCVFILSQHCLDGSGETWTRQTKAESQAHFAPQPMIYHLLLPITLRSCLTSALLWHSWKNRKFFLLFFVHPLCFISTLYGATRHTPTSWLAGWLAPLACRTTCALWLFYETSCFAVTVTDLLRSLVIAARGSDRLWHE